MADSNNPTPGNPGRTTNGLGTLNPGASRSWPVHPEAQARPTELLRASPRNRPGTWETP